MKAQADREAMPYGAVTFLFTDIECRTRWTPNSAPHRFMMGESAQWIEFCRKRTALGPGPSIYTGGHLATALDMVGAGDEARAASEELCTADRVTDKPLLVSWALIAYGFVRHATGPVAAYEAHRRGVEVAQESCNRLLESYHSASLCRLAATHQDPIAAFGSIAHTMDTMHTIRNYFEAGDFGLLAQPLGVLTAHLDRLGYLEPTATISGTLSSPLARNYYPEIDLAVAHLRDVLGADLYESFAHAGRSVTNAGMAKYALEQIELARSRLVQADESE